LPAPAEHRITPNALPKIQIGLPDKPHYYCNTSRKER